MQQIPVNASLRSDGGKGVARKLRAAGKVPAVIYGAGKEGSTPVTVETTDMVRIMAKTKGSLALLQVKVAEESKPRLAVLQEVQTDHLGSKLMHIDFLEVRPDQEITVDLPLDFVGEPAGAAEGGILSVATYSVSVKGLIADIPDSLEVDVSGMNVGDSIHVEDLDLAGKAEVVFDENYTIVSCLVPQLPTLEEEEEEGEGEEGEEGAEGETEESGEEASQSEGE